uniref:Receptor-like protein EIX1 n=1 Tax=Elaeis guineensis var. tenera TaxID=51953 RepID=A0A6J0PIW5_ELAGV|nr:receptor-like protein EIX1 [Elaeis guineensis]
MANDGGCNKRSLTITRVMLIGFLLCVGDIPFCLCLGSGDGSKMGGSSIESEKRALLTIRADVYDPDEWLSSWTGQDCCQWRGVGCDNTTSGHVAKLDLRFPYGYELIYGTEFLGPSKVSPSLSSLIHLRYLDLSMNNFSGAPIPEFIGSLMHLEYLNLSKAWFGGPIPLQIGNLSSLHYLDLRGGYMFYDQVGMYSEYYAIALHVNDLQWLSRIISLQYLDLSFANLSKASNWLREINLHPSLSVLKLSSTGLPGIPSTLQHVNFTSLTMLSLSHNAFESTIPSWLLNISNLVRLELRACYFHGSLSNAVAMLGYLNHLKNLDFSENYITGGISQSLRNNKYLEHLDLSENQITTAEILGNLSQLRHALGYLTEERFSNLTSLDYFDLSYNSLTMIPSDGWIPSFNASYIYMTSYHLGPKFSAWLQTQAHLKSLWLDETGISDKIPSWLWYRDIFDLNVSHDCMEGQLPRSLGSHVDTSLDLSSNCFSGPIPYLVAEVIILSNNSFSGPTSLDFSEKVLDLSSNELSGGFPDCWRKLHQEILDVPENMRVEDTTSTMACPIKLQSLHVRNNRLSGNFPSFLRLCTQLVILDLGENKFSGNIPIWIGESLSSLRVLHPRSNSFDSNIPMQISSLSSLQVLDLAYNNFSGNPPSSFRNFTAW